MPKQILCINGAVGAGSGNTGKFLSVLEGHLKAQGLELKRWDLAHWKTPFKANLEEKLEQLSNAHGVVFATGTYWDSWGSPLQAFLEAATFLEGRAQIFGKPTAVLVSMHSVGGKEVLSRLQGVLSTMGFLIPPHSGMALSLVGQLALQSKSEWSEDFWSLQDLEIVAHNLRAAIEGSAYKSWEVDRSDPNRPWVSL